MLTSVDLEIGASYVVEIPGEGRVTAALRGSEEPIADGHGSDHMMPRWRIEYQGLEYIVMERAIIRPAAS